MSGGAVIGKNICAGDNGGSKAKYPNDHLKYGAVGLGSKSEGQVTIQFIKAKTFGVMTNFGTHTFNLPDKPTDIIFFWPLDTPGDSWNTFVSGVEAAVNIGNKAADIAKSF